MNKYYTILTDKGKEKISNAILVGNKLNISKMLIGDGFGSSYEPSSNQTELKNKLYEADIISVSIDSNNDSLVVVQAIIPPNVGNFYIRELGLSDSENNLIAIAKFPETYKPTIESGSIKEVVIKMILKVENSEVINLVISEELIGGTITADNFSMYGLTVKNKKNNITTFEITEDGRIFGNFESIKMGGNSVNDLIKDEVDASKTYTDQKYTELMQNAEKIEAKIIDIGHPNLVKNSNFKAGLLKFAVNGSPIIDENPIIDINKGKVVKVSGNIGDGLFQYIETIPGNKYICSFYAEAEDRNASRTLIGIEGIKTINLYDSPEFKRHSFVFEATSTQHTFISYCNQENCFFSIGRIMVNEGDILQAYRELNDEIYSENVRFDTDGMSIESNVSDTVTNVNDDGFAIMKKDTLEKLLQTTSEGIIAKGGSFSVKDDKNGETMFWGRDILINNQRALVGTNSNPEEALQANTLYINYDGDFKNGTMIDGDILAHQGRPIISQNAYEQGETGYLDLNIGLIFQWGVVRTTIQEGQSCEFGVKFPVSFNNRCFFADANIDTIDNGYSNLEGKYISGVKRKDRGGVVFYANNVGSDNLGTSITFSWFAIGN